MSEDVSRTDYLSSTPDPNQNGEWF